MANYLVIVGLLILGAASLQASSPAKVLSEYKRRTGIVAKLASLYEKYEDGRDTPANETLREAFITHFDENFDDTTNWIVNAFTFEAPVPAIMQAVINETQTDYNKVKEFGAQAENTLRLAFTMKENHAELANPEENVDVEEDQITKRTSLVTVRVTIGKTLTYIKTTAWKGQYKRDIYDILRAPFFNKTLSQDISNFLKKKYFYRDWFTIMYNESRPSKVCEDTTATSYKGWRLGLTVRVFQADVSRRNRIVYAKSILNNVSDRRRYFVCKDRINDIVEESKYACNSNALPLFGVFGGEIRGFSKDWIVSKTVVRSRPLFKCNPELYSVIIFV